MLFTKMKQLFFFYKNTHIAYTITGIGMPIVLLHGYCENSEMWTDTIQKLKKQYMLITIDLPGFGHSACIEEGYTIADLSEMVILLIEQLSLDKVSVLGHSMGGYVGLEILANYGNRLVSLGLIHSHCFEDTAERKANRLKSLDFIEKHGTEPFLKSFFVNLFAPQNYDANKNEIASLIRNTAKLSNKAVIDGAIALLSRKSHVETLQKTQLPIFIYAGEQDSAIPTDYSLKMASLAKFCDFHLYSNIGHMGFYENKKEFLKSVNAFLNRVYA